MARKSIGTPNITQNQQASSFDYVHDSLSRENISKVIENEFFNAIKHVDGGFLAVVLRIKEAAKINDDGSGLTQGIRYSAEYVYKETDDGTPPDDLVANYYQVYIRPLWNNTLPNPKGFSKEEQVRIARGHPVAVNRDFVFNESGGVKLKAGDVVRAIPGNGPNVLDNMTFESVPIDYRPDLIGLDFVGVTLSDSFKLKKGSGKIPKKSGETDQQAAARYLKVDKVPKGVTPATGVYNGDEKISGLTKGTKVMNGFPTHGATILALPDTDYWQASDSLGYLIKDYLNYAWKPGMKGANFNGLARAWVNKFGQKLQCGGFRSFRGQKSVRDTAIKAGKCESHTSAYGGPCRSARTGQSPHGWGQAIDISILFHSKRSGNTAPKDEDRAFNSIEYQWLKANAPKYGFYHPPFAKNRGKGGTPEAWHWEVKNPVVTVN